MFYVLSFFNLLPGQITIYSFDIGVVMLMCNVNIGFGSRLFVKLFSKPSHSRDWLCLSLTRALSTISVVSNGIFISPFLSNERVGKVEVSLFRLTSIITNDMVVSIVFRYPIKHSQMRTEGQEQFQFNLIDTPFEAKFLCFNI